VVDAPARRRPQFHPLRVARVEKLTDDAVAVTFDVPPELADDYAFRPGQALVGVLVAVAALAMFHLTHRALGRNWSVSLEVRESHKLITHGVYRHVRHPMYTAFWLWAVAQALLLPNLVAGLSGLVGFGTLYVLRVGEEEDLMVDAFGDEYRAYMARTARLVPWVH
jgi:protein-S-isoprenylcysteine O-methyltransferase Ste14